LPRRLAFIRHVRELGFEIEAIRALLTLQDDPSQPRATADGIARARLAEVEQRIGGLVALKAELELMVEGCRHGHVGECRVSRRWPIMANAPTSITERENGASPASIRRAPGRNPSRVSNKGNAAPTTDSGIRRGRSGRGS
jgi:MerR, DNA binding